MPTGRKRKIAARPGQPRRCAYAGTTSVRGDTRHRAASRYGFRRAASCALVGQQPFQNSDCGMEKKANRTVLHLAVPPSVIELFTESGDHTIDILVEAEASATVKPLIHGSTSPLKNGSPRAPNGSVSEPAPPRGGPRHRWGRYRSRAGARDCMRWRSRAGLLAARCCRDSLPSGE